MWPLEVIKKMNEQKQVECSVCKRTVPVSEESKLCQNKNKPTKCKKSDNVFVYGEFGIQK